MSTTNPSSADHQGRPIRFGVLSPSTHWQEWELRCIEHLTALPGVELALLILCEEPASPPVTSPLLWRLFSTYLARPRSCRRSDVLPRLGAVPRLSTHAVDEGGPFPSLPPDDVDTIRQHGLDFLLRIGPSTVRGKVTQAAQHGLWAFHHGQEGKPCLPGFWEVHDGAAVTEGSLQRLGDEPGQDATLFQGYLKTVTYSYSKNIDQLCFESASWPARLCGRMRNSPAGLPEIAQGYRGPAWLSFPTNGQMMRFLLRTGLAFLRNHWNTIVRHEQWNVGFVEQPLPTFLGTVTRPAIRWLDAPHRKWFAGDPFAVVKDNHAYLLYEEFDYRADRGKICSGELEGDGVRTPRTVFEEPFHLSYPYLLEHDGEVYCLPEMSQSGEVVLYKAVELPHRWSRVATLLRGVRAVDSTVFPHDGRWWLMCTQETEYGDPNVNLFVWHAEDLLGPWMPHAANPVKTDIRSARPAGPPFTHDGCLYRPAQDCSRTYGGRVVLQRVTRLTPTAFCEEYAGAVEPSRDSLYPDGLHTLCRAGNRTLVDGKRFIFDWHACRCALARKLGRLGRKLRGGQQ